MSKSSFIIKNCACVRACARALYEYMCLALRFLEDVTEFREIICTSGTFERNIYECSNFKPPEANPGLFVCFFLTFVLPLFSVLY
jgi:hypothetical protein